MAIAGEYQLFTSSIKFFVCYQGSTLGDAEILQKTQLSPRKIELPENILQRHVFNKKTIGFFIGASNTDKVLHPKNWAIIFDYIKTKYKNNFDIAMFGFGAVETKLSLMLIDEIKKLGYTQSDIISFVGLNELETDIKYCGGLSLSLTNDSGFMHVSSLFNIPTISFFGYTPADNFMTQVFNEDKFFKSKSTMSCSPCLYPSRCKHKVIDNDLSFRNCMVHKRDDIFEKIDNALNLTKI